MMPEQVRYWTKLLESGFFFSWVPDYNLGCRNADAGLSFLDVDAQLWDRVIELRLCRTWSRVELFYTANLFSILIER
jgi:hypothetical protein